MNVAVCMRARVCVCVSVRACVCVVSCVPDLIPACCKWCSSSHESRMTTVLWNPTLTRQMYVSGALLPIAADSDGQKLATPQCVLYSRLVSTPSPRRHADTQTHIYTYMHAEAKRMEVTVVLAWWSKLAMATHSVRPSRGTAAVRNISGSKGVLKVERFRYVVASG